MSATRTVFLDRDGVINRKARDGGYVLSWPEFEFLPGALDALRLLTEARYRLIVVTNQRCVARNLITEPELCALHERMLAAIESAGARLDAIYYCPHAEAACECRKPGVGMFLRARAECPDIDFAHSVVIGDSLTDIEAGQRLGCRTILVDDDATGAIADEGTDVAMSLHDAVLRLLLA